MAARIKLKDKHWELGRHFERFCDRRWFPNYKLDAVSLEAFIRLESYGPRSLTPEDLELIKPLASGKQMYDLTLRMLTEEMAEWWSINAGWYAPIAATLKSVFWEDKPRDKVYIRALCKMMRSCYEDGFIGFLMASTSLSQEEKCKYLSAWKRNND